MDGGAPARRLSGGNVSEENIRSLCVLPACKKPEFEKTVIYDYLSDFIINE